MKKISLVLIALSLVLGRAVACPPDDPAPSNGGEKAPQPTQPAKPKTPQPTAPEPGQ